MSIENNRDALWRLSNCEAEKLELQAQLAQVTKERDANSCGMQKALLMVAQGDEQVQTLQEARDKALASIKASQEQLEQQIQQARDEAYYKAAHFIEICSTDTFSLLANEIRKMKGTK